MSSPPPQSGLGARIAHWLEQIDPWRWVSDYARGFRQRHREYARNMPVLFREYLKRGDFTGAYWSNLINVAWVVFGGTSQPITEPVTQLEILGNASAAAAREASQTLAPLLKQLATSEVGTAFTELVGTVVTTPVVSLLEDMAAHPEYDIEVFVKRFHGIASGLPWASEMIDSSLRAVLGERAPQVGKQLMSLYWGLGLGFLGWQTLAPLLTAGLQPGLERKYNRLYRPARFSAAQMADLYALGKRTSAEVGDVLRDLGWRDTDIQAWVELSYRTLAESDLWQLYHNGQLSQADMDRRLRALGYRPEDLPLVYQANVKEEEKAAPGYLLSTAKAAFKERLVPESEFRSILTALKYNAREIDLQVQLINADREVDARRLTVGQVKELYNAAIVSRTEASHHLQVLGYERADADSLIQAWDVAATPKAVRLNRGTILEGFTDGVLDRNEAVGLLRSECGYDQQQAELIIRIEEAQAPKQVAVGPQGAAPATLAMLTQWYQRGLLTAAQLQARPELAIYAVEDRQRLVSLITVQPQETSKELTATALLPAYQYGVLTREEVAARLAELGYRPVDAELTITVFEKAHPEVFGGAVEPEPLSLSLSALADMAAAGLLDRQTMLARPELAGYTVLDRENLVKLMFDQAVSEPLELGTEGLLQAFLYGVIDEQTLTNRLLGRGVAAGDVSILIDTFKLQHPAQFGTPARVVLKQPTVGSVQLAYQRGLIDADGFRARLGAMGYNDDAIQLFQLNAEFQVPADPKQLTQAQVIRLYKQGDMGRPETQRRLIQLGYTINDAELLIRAEHLAVADTEAAAWFEAGLLDQTGFLAIVTDLGFTPDDIDDYLGQFGG